MLWGSDRAETPLLSGTGVFIDFDTFAVEHCVIFIWNKVVHDRYSLTNLDKPKHDERCELFCMVSFQ